MQRSSFSFIYLPGFHGTDSLYSELVRNLEGRSSDSHSITYPVTLSQDYETLYQWLVEELDLSHPRVIIAESFSSPLAIRLAAEFPHSVKALIIAGGFCSSPLPAILSALPFQPLMMLNPPKRFIRYFLLDDTSEKELIDKVAESTSALPSKTFAQRVRAILSLKAEPCETQVQAATLLIQASRDQVLDKNTQLIMQSHLPHARVHWIDSPHLIFQQYPVYCSELISSFLDTLPE